MIENFEQINKRLLEIKSILKVREEVSLREGVINFQAELDWDNESKAWIIYFGFSFKSDNLSFTVSSKISLIILFYSIFTNL